MDWVRACSREGSTPGHRRGGGSGRRGDFECLSGVRGGGRGVEVEVVKGRGR